MSAAGLVEQRFLVHGMGVTNTEVAKALLAHGASVVLSDDGDPVGLLAITDELGATGGDTARAEGRVEVVPAPDAAQVAAIVGRVDAVVPTPGLPERHPLLAAARDQGRPILSEFDLAGAWDDRPVLAITGTNGKTTVTTLVDAMLAASGVRSAAVGNTEVPLVAAIADPDTQVFVVEASSFRLAHSRRFRPLVATWLELRRGPPRRALLAGGLPGGEGQDLRGPGARRRGGHQRR